jgi:hypothetical protein
MRIKTLILAILIALALAGEPVGSADACCGIPCASC